MKTKRPTRKQLLATAQQAKQQREVPKELLDESKKQRNLLELQNFLKKLVLNLDELAYKIENTKSEKLKAKLEKKFDKRLTLVISLQQGNFSVDTH